MKMMILIILLLVFGSSKKLVLISEATTTTIINCFTDRPNSTKGFSCKGDDTVMKYPFWPMEGVDQSVNSSTDQICGYPGFGVSCTPFNYYEDGRNMSTQAPTLNISNDLYYIGDFDPASKIFMIVNRDFWISSCPRPRRNFTLDDDQARRLSLADSDVTTNLNIFYNCSVPPPPGSYDTTKDNSRTQPPCLQQDNYNNQTQQQQLRSYAFSDEEIHDDRVNSGSALLSNWSNYAASTYCQDIVILPLDRESLSYHWSYLGILQSRFILFWSTPVAIDDGGKCSNCENYKGLCIYSIQNGRYLNCSCPPGTQHSDDGDCFPVDTSPSPSPVLLPADTSPSPSPSPTPNGKTPKTITGPTTTTHHRKTPIGIKLSAGILGGLIILILFFLFIYLKIQRKRREIASNTPSVESFLKSYGCLSLQRYKYSQIKKITNSFTEKLGQGGFGTVYKGTLVDGRYVAVKVLVNDPAKKTSGEDFMNEVATIGRTNHVNVVALIGFCSSGSKRALVYEFMANGSLEKFIYANNETNTDASVVGGAIDNNVVQHHLGWEKLYQISVGIAKGLEYLHRGCNTRILHFDIKPHNILLDENFCPKISDFGLARLCPTRDSVVSMRTGFRGTNGYAAPEFICRNLGGVSHKSDVYSYGMMVFEMVGGRKNIDPSVENPSEIYFPHWIYNRLEEQGDKIGDLLKLQEIVEEEMARKMIMVALWCIQTNPLDRPSMNKVVDMLEGSIDNLQRPPKPFVDSSSSSSPPPKS